MGRNTDIKRFNAKAAGQPLEFLDTKHARTPVVVELLRSPWLVRASELVSRNDTSATKRAEKVVTVGWDAERQCPLYFERDHVRYRIDALIQVWATDRSWWDPRKRVSRRYWRVLARGGVYDLAYERVTGAWLLVGIQD